MFNSIAEMAAWTKENANIYGDQYITEDPEEAQDLLSVLTGRSIWIETYGWLGYYHRLNLPFGLVQKVSLDRVEGGKRTLLTLGAGRFQSLRLCPYEVCGAKPAEVGIDFILTFHLYPLLYARKLEEEKKGLALRLNQEEDPEKLRALGLQLLVLSDEIASAQRDGFAAYLSERFLHGNLEPPSHEENQALRGDPEGGSWFARVLSIERTAYSTVTMTLKVIEVTKCTKNTSP